MIDVITEDTSARALEENPSIMDDFNSGYMAGYNKDYVFTEFPSLAFCHSYFIAKEEQKEGAYISLETLAQHAHLVITLTLIQKQRGIDTDIIGKDMFEELSNLKKGVNLFQAGVATWIRECFSEEISQDKTERNDRFIEESLELAQSLGYTKERAHALVDYVFDREKGDPEQEVGGVMVTLAALCDTNGLDMADAGNKELERINQPDIIQKIREKQENKPTGSALPQ